MFSHSFFKNFHIKRHKGEPFRRNRFAQGPVCLVSDFPDFPRNLGEDPIEAHAKDSEKSQDSPVSFTDRERNNRSNQEENQNQAHNQKN